MTLECAQSAMKSLKHRDISRVNIHSATFVYLHILSVSANLRRHVWDFIVRCAVLTFLALEILKNRKIGSVFIRLMTFYKNWLLDQMKHIVNLVKETMREKRLLTIVYHAMSTYVCCVSNIIERIWRPEITR